VQRKSDVPAWSRDEVFLDVALRAVRARADKEKHPGALRPCLPEGESNIVVAEALQAALAIKEER
jgi:hypothetical protein